MEKNKDWGETEYTKKVRISESDLEWLKKNRGKNTIAGFLSKIIKKYGNARLRSKKGMETSS